LYANTTGLGNTATGQDALQNNTTGNVNTAIGQQALSTNPTGTSNIAIGFNAALNVSGGNSNNIHIGNLGAASDSNTIRIGDAATQTSFFVAGVRGVITANNSAIPVVIDSNGQLGTVSSSRRFKEDIHDMGEATADLMRLRPVTFLQAAVRRWLRTDPIRSHRRRSRRGLPGPGRPLGGWPD